MNLIDLYVNEVGRNLPIKMREDIEKEIRSLIEDTLDDESASQGRPPDEEMIVGVLQRLKSPEKMAASYLPPRYLIGPELFPYYLSVLRIIVAVVTILVALGQGLSIGVAAQQTGGLLTAIIEAFVSLVNGLFQAVAWVTVIFAIIQWAAPGIKLPEKTWDPRKLKAEPDPQRVSTSEKVGEIAGLVFGLALFNLFQEWIGFSFMQNGVWVHLPVLSQAFSMYLPWLDLIWVVEIGRDGWLLVRGRWSILLRWVTVGLTLGSAVIAGWMLTGPSIIYIDPSSFVRVGWVLTPQSAVQLANGINSLVRLPIGIILVFGIVNLIRQVYPLVQGDRAPAQFASKWFRSWILVWSRIFQKKE